MSITVIVTTYNRPDALRAVFQGYRAQRDRDFTLVIADDGSREDTARDVARFAASAPFEVRHVWQEDRGFRAAAVRNRALAATWADYVVFSDGDCIPLAGFVGAPAAGGERTICRGKPGASFRWPDVPGPGKRLARPGLGGFRVVEGPFPERGQPAFPPFPPPPSFVRPEMGRDPVGRGHDVQPRRVAGGPCGRQWSR